MKTCPCNIQRYFSEATIENFVGTILIFFFFNILAQNIHCGYKLEPPPSLQTPVFSSPVRKYRKIYCSTPVVGVSVGVSVCVGVALMLKFLVKVFISLYLLNMWMDYVDNLHVGRYWSEVLFCTIMTHASDLEVKVTDLKFLVKVFVSLYLLNV